MSIERPDWYRPIGWSACQLLSMIIRKYHFPWSRLALLKSSSEHPYTLLSRVITLSLSILLMEQKTVALEGNYDHNNNLKYIISIWFAVLSIQYKIVVSLSCQISLSQWVSATAWCYIMSSTDCTLQHCLSMHTQYNMNVCILYWLKEQFT